MKYAMKQLKNDLRDVAMQQMFILKTVKFVDIRSFVLIKCNLESELQVWVRAPLPIGHYFSDLSVSDYR